eukprot:COSAG02_NODE_10892_length_1837_cov_1.476410_2_plen_50_part_01
MLMHSRAVVTTLRILTIGTRYALVTAARVTRLHRVQPRALVAVAFTGPGR